MIKLTLFSSSSCKVCFQIKEKLVELSERLDVKLEEIKIEENPKVCSEKLILSAPTVILEVEGKEVRRWGRFLRLQEVEFEVERFKNLLGSGRA